jgi:hypothetical protein
MVPGQCPGLSGGLAWREAACGAHDHPTTDQDCRSLDWRGAIYPVGSVRLRQRQHPLGLVAGREGGGSVRPVLLE